MLACLICETEIFSLQCPVWWHVCWCRTLCPLLSVPHGFYSGLGGTKSSFKPQFADLIFQYPVIMITIIIPAPLAAEGCGWGGVVWILAVSLYLSLCFQPPPTHQHQWQQTMCLLYLYLVRTSQNKMFCEPFCGTLVPYLYILLSGFYDQNVSILLRGPHHWTHPHLCAWYLLLNFHRDGDSPSCYYPLLWCRHLWLMQEYADTAMKY